MAESDFKIRVLTPAGLALEETVTSVKLQAVDGQIGILPQHTSYTGLLGKGTLEYATSSSSQNKKINIAGGFCSFSSGVLTVLADSLLPA